MDASTPINRRLTARESRVFAPQGPARSHDEEIGYRRGFDQGVAALAYAIGIDPADLQRMAWKKRIAAFRHGYISEAPTAPTTDEKNELLQHLKR